MPSLGGSGIAGGDDPSGGGTVGEGGYGLGGETDQGLFSMDTSRSVISNIPFFGQLLNHSGMLDAARGDPNPETGMGVSGPGGSGGVGGGPMAMIGTLRQRGQSLNQPMANKAAAQFQINPMQVQNDMRGGWGMPQPGGYQQPQMNPFSMYGNSQNPFVPQFGGYQMPPSMSQGQLGFDWGNYMNTFGGK